MIRMINFYNFITIVTWTKIEYEDVYRICDYVY